MLPLIPLLCIAAVLGGGVGLGWYYGLSEDERSTADRIANDLAWKLYQKALDELTKAEAEHIARLVRSRIA